MQNEQRIQRGARAAQSCLGRLVSGRARLPSPWSSPSFFFQLHFHLCYMHIQLVTHEQHSKSYSSMAGGAGVKLDCGCIGGGCSGATLDARRRCCWVGKGLIGREPPK